jgi:hypothetical protein
MTSRSIGSSDLEVRAIDIARVPAWTPEMVWKLRELLLDAGIVVTVQKPTRAMQSAGFKHGIKYINQTIDIWQEMMAYGPGGNEFDQKISSLLNAMSFATPPAPAAVVCGGDGIGNANCGNPKHKVISQGITWMDWRCQSCCGTGRSTWE